MLGLAPSAAAAAQLRDSTGALTDTLAKLTWSIDHGNLPDWALQRVVVNERHINAAGIAGVGVNHLVAARGGQRCIHPLDETVDHETVLDLTHSKQIGSLAGVHRRDHGGKLVDLAIPQFWCPAGDVVFDCSEHFVGASSQRYRVLLIEQILPGSTTRRDKSASMLLLALPGSETIPRSVRPAQDLKRCRGGP